MSLSIFDAGNAIDNIKTDIDAGYEAGRYRRKRDGKYTDSGLRQKFLDKLDSLQSKYGVVALGTVLDKNKGKFNFKNPALYYPTKDNDHETYQEDFRKRFEATMDAEIEAASRELAGEDYESAELSEEEKEEYDRLRRQYQNKKYYYGSKGVDLEDLPKIATRGLRTEEDLAYLKLFINNVDRAIKNYKEGL